jgi:hypothetical protein
MQLSAFDSDRAGRAADPVLVLIAEHRAVHHLLPTWSKPFPPDAIALGMLGAPLTSTEGVVALFAYAREHVEQAGRHHRQYGRRSFPRLGTVGPDEAGGDNESAERTAAGTKSGTA